MLTNSLNSISPEAVEEIGKDDFSMLRNSIQTYSNNIDSLYESYQLETKVVEKVRAEGRKLETFAKNGKHAKELTISFILNFRRLEKNYMLFRDRKSFNKLNAALLQLRNLTPICYECYPYIKAVNTLIQD